MLEAIRQFITGRIAGQSPAAAESPARAGVEVAACALLLELAHADGEFSEAERTHIEQSLGRHFALDAETVRELIALAALERQRSVDHFQFTRAISQEFDLGRKMLLAEVMWGVILADGTIAEHETYLVRKLANLLDLQPGYLAQARRSATGEAAG